MLYSTLALGVLLTAASAYAQASLPMPLRIGQVEGHAVAVNEPCTQIGVTELSDDNTDIVACLQSTVGTGGSPLWKAQYSGKDGGSFVQTYSNYSGSTTCTLPNPMVVGPAGSPDCSCPTGYTAAPSSQSTWHSGNALVPDYTNIETGFTCAEGSAPAQKQPVYDWVYEGTSGQTLWPTLYGPQSSSNSSACALPAPPTCNAYQASLLQTYSTTASSTWAADCSTVGDTLTADAGKGCWTCTWNWYQCLQTGWQ